MDDMMLAKNCGCVTQTCNNRRSSVHWCSNYSCSYNRSLHFGTPKKKKKEEPEKTLIEQQREAQKVVMEGLRKHWETRDGRQDGSGGGGGGRYDSDFQHSPRSCWQDNNNSPITPQSQCGTCLNLPSWQSQEAFPERLLPSDISTNYIPFSSNPYEYTGRKRKVRSPRGTKEKPEPEGNPCSVDATTSSLGYRPTRRHFVEKPTFLWF